MQYFITGLALFAATTIARPSAIDNTPAGGWESVDYPEGTGANLASYPAGTGENLPSYPPGTGENLPYYPPGTGENAGNGACTNGPFKFTSTYHIVATPDQVRNTTMPPTVTGGLPGAIGYYDLGLNSDLDLICYNIRFVGFRGEYQSPANTATHIHTGVAGANGPPRIAFPNPQGADGEDKVSRGCLTGPFKTGVVNATTNADSGDGFTIAMLEANPAGFFADSHSSLAVPGAFRGQVA